LVSPEDPPPEPPPPDELIPGVTAPTTAAGAAPLATDEVVVAPGRVVVVAPAPAVLVAAEVATGALALVDVEVVVGTMPAPTWIWRGLLPPEKTLKTRKSSAQAPRK
jgi:hypothetical protein